MRLTIQIFNLLGPLLLLQYILAAPLPAQEVSANHIDRTFERYSEASIVGTAQSQDQLGPVPAIVARDASAPYNTAGPSQESDHWTQKDTATVAGLGVPLAALATLVSVQLAKQHWGGSDDKEYKAEGMAKSKSDVFPHTSNEYHKGGAYSVHKASKQQNGQQHTGRVDVAGQSGLSSNNPFRPAAEQARAAAVKVAGHTSLVNNPYRAAPLRPMIGGI